MYSGLVTMVDAVDESSISETELLDDRASGGFRTILQNSDFTKLWLGQSVSNIGSAISAIAFLFFAFELTGSPMVMAIIAMVETAPAILLAGVIGVYIDRWDRKKVLIASDIVRVATALMIPFVAIMPSFLPPIYWLYIITFTFSVANAFFYPARSASIPNLVETKDLVTANSLSQMTFQLITLIVTPLGGVLVAVTRPDYFIAFAIDASTFALSAVFIWSISTSLVPKVTSDREQSFARDLLDGASVIRRNRILTFIIIMFSVVMIGGGMINALIVPFFEGELGFDAIQFSFLLSATAISGIITAVILGNKKEINRPLNLISFALFFGGLVILSIALVSDYFIILILFSMIGLVNVMIAIPSSAIMQEIVADDMRGRVFSFQSIMTNTAMIMGMGVAGFWAETVGSSRPPIFSGGVILAVVGFLSFIAIGALKLHKRLDEIRDSAAAQSKSNESVIDDEILQSDDLQTIADDE